MSAPSPPRQSAAALFVGQPGGLANIKVSACGTCGRRSFPPDIHGCRGCGAYGGALHDELVPAEGTIEAAVTVHRHRGPGPKPPFVVATIALAAGCVIRGLLAAGTAVPARGDHVAGRVTTSDDGSTDLLFLPEAR